MADVADGLRKCGNCGALLGAARGGTVTCAYCGATHDAPAARMPPPGAESLLEGLREAFRGSVSAQVLVSGSTHYEVNGVRYDDLAAMPPEVRSVIERMEHVVGVPLAADGRSAAAARLGDGGVAVALEAQRTDTVRRVVGELRPADAPAPGPAPRPRITLSAQAELPGTPPWATRLVVVAILATVAVVALALVGIAAAR